MDISMDMLYTPNLGWFMIADSMQLVDHLRLLLWIPLYRSVLSKESEDFRTTAVHSW